ncbi:MAG TPA: tRNA (adenosine(37)-N6)-threonylcarbamoyltransferase complex dimerization subunit type 1 TsaB [Gemmatimonadaceae bacterium]|nr:tRNA (adenosine(37)-N6)-threonylcarbamoyltransferase complex dimerization subunit type 1 TsaB [Gemmatimonadaceae bacterium]
MITLGIDASTYVGSVAVIRDGVVISEREPAMRGEHEERLMPAVADALADAAVAPNEIDRIACGAGPGSFTSLRIAGAIAKGLALTARAPLYPVPSLLLIVAGANPGLAPGRYVAALDAMRGEMFAQLFVVTESSIVAESGTTIVPRADLDAVARSHAARAVGPAEEIVAAPHARGVALLGHHVSWPEAADLATWEPDYGRLAEAQVRWEAAHGRALVPR